MNERNSEPVKGYELYIKKEFKELDALIKLLDVEFRRFIKSECI